MFWVDKLLENIKGPQVIEDAWTPSGIVHMGSLKGPVIHDAIFKALRQKGVEAKYIFGFDDLDPIDGLPENLKATHEQYMGIPISNVPAPDGNGTFGDYYGNKFKALFDSLDIKPEIYKTSEVYKSGKFDKAIKIVLDNVEKVRQVYADTYKKEISKEWFPLQVVCPNCGKLGTTKVTEWDGQEVKYECSPTLVKWAQGCGSTGKISPFGGNAKMPWKVEWASCWYTFGVTIEGAGKDHASAGGSYDIAMQIIDKVFGRPKPLKFGYEFFLTGGKKMSSSKGLGLTGEELLEILTPQAARFLMIKTKPEQAVEFDPRSLDVIPRIYSDYQAASKSEDDDQRAFELSQIGETEKVPQLSFLSLIQLVQMPNVDNKIKEQDLSYWAPYARRWVEKYAPEKIKFSVQENLPAQAKTLTQNQKEFLGKKLLPEIDKSQDADEYQQNIYEWAKEFDLSSAEAFEAIYKSLIGKDHGPKAAWLIFEHKDLVKKRFKEILTS